MRGSIGALTSSVSSTKTAVNSTISDCTLCGTNQSERQVSMSSTAYTPQHGLLRPTHRPLSTVTPPLQQDQGCAASLERRRKLHSHAAAEGSATRGGRKQKQGVEGNTAPARPG